MQPQLPFIFASCCVENTRFFSSGSLVNCSNINDPPLIGAIDKKGLQACPFS